MRPDSEKVEVLRKLKLPTLKKLHSHLGCYNYLSRYIKDFASIFAPLYQKVKKNIKFEFNEASFLELSQDFGKFHNFFILRSGRIDTTNVVKKVKNIHLSLAISYEFQIEKCLFKKFN